MKNQMKKWKKKLAYIIVAVIMISALLPSGLVHSKAEEDSAVTVSIKEGQVKSLENGKSYIILAYYDGAKAMSAMAKGVSESSGTYNYLKAVSVTDNGTSITFPSEEDAAYCKFTAEENSSEKGRFRLRNGSAWLYKYYQMMEPTGDESLASWFIYSKSNGLQHTNSDYISNYKAVTYREGVFKGWTSVTYPLYIYEINEAGEEYTVNFDSNGGSAVSAVSVEAGKTVTKPEDPTKENYNFAGWFTDKNYTIQWDFSTAINESITLYAKWESVDGESFNVYVQHVCSMEPGKTYLITDESATLAMKAESGNELYDNTRGANEVIRKTDSGKTYFTFHNLEEKKECVWLSGSYEGGGDGEVTLSYNGELLDSYLSSLHYPAQVDDSNVYVNNILFYADEEGIHSADTDSLLCYRTSPSVMVGFAPNSGESAQLYEVVSEDYVHTHTLTHIPEVTPTCTEKGVGEYYKCATCGLLFSDASGENIISAPTVLEATGHDYGEWTFISEKKHQRICKNDSSHIETQNHNWDVGMVTKQPTTTQAGEITYTCSDCQEQHVEEIASVTGNCSEADSAGYLVSVKPATALVAGKQYVVLSEDKTKTMEASNKATEYGGLRLSAADITLAENDEEISFQSYGDADGAIWDCKESADAVVLANHEDYLYNNLAYLWCENSDDDTEEGTVFSYTFNEEENYGLLVPKGSTSYHVGYDSENDAFLARPDVSCFVYEVVEVIGYNAESSHHLVKVKAQDPSCSKEGNVEYYICSKCHKIFKDSTGAEESLITREDTVIPAKGHVLEKVESKEATCECEGNEAYYICSQCHKYFSDAEGIQEIQEGAWVIEPLGHDWDEGETTTEALCETGGVITYTCKHNLSHKKTVIVSPGGHNWQLVESVEASCTEDGYEIYRCTKCHTEKKMNIQKATGHTPVTRVEKYPATWQSPGENEIITYCSKCGAELSREYVIVPPVCSAYEDVVYQWSKDGKRVTATAVNKNDTSKTLTETVPVTTVVTEKATDKKSGSMKATAVFYNGIFTTQTKIISIPAEKLDAPIINGMKKGISKKQLQWSKVSGADAYRVSYQKVGSTKWITKTLTDTKLTVLQQKEGTCWKYRVAAIKYATDTTQKIISDDSAMYYYYEKKVSEFKLKALKNAMKISWKIDKKASGYQVVYSKNKNMKSANYIEVRSAKKKNKKISKLKSGQKYYVQVRPYILKDKKKYYGDWSSKKSIKI
ncbi:InlB B-repeat-containing protein [Eubacterium oxidoreducens]|nr:InlB B-repeat-containing protein [Eubacterium oxidoreducens]